MLETINIQYTDEHLRTTCSLTTLSCETLVDNRNKPFKQTRVDEFRDTVSNDGRLRSIERSNDLLRASNDLLLDRPLLEIG